MSDSLCRSHIRPGPLPSAPRQRSQGSPWPSPTFWEASSCRPRRPGAARRPPPRRCPDPPRARACRPDASCRPSSWRSWPRGRSSKPSPRWKASCPCACGPDAPGPRPWASRCRSPGPGAPASPGSLHPCRAARCCAAPRWPPWSRHPPRCARPSPDPPRRSRPEPSRRPPRGLHGAGARGSSTARNGPAPAHGSPVAGTPAATGNPSNATPDRALSRCPRSSPPGACGNSARAAPRARPSWPRNRAGSSPRQRRRSRPRSAPTAGGRKTHDPASAASPPSPPSSPPDDPSAVPSPSANPPVKSEHQGIRPEQLPPPLASSADFVNGLLGLTFMHPWS